jgi:hypothetical protein
MDDEFWKADSDQMPAVAQAKYDGNWREDSRDDAPFMADFGAWMNLWGDADDGKHSRTCNLTWWCWNEVSPDTGNLYCTEGPDLGKVCKIWQCPLALCIYLP